MQCLPAETDRRRIALGEPGLGDGVEFRIPKGPIPRMSMGGTRGFFQTEARMFLGGWVAVGPAQHFALGHRAGSLEKVASILGIECATVVRESK